MRACGPLGVSAALSVIVWCAGAAAEEPGPPAEEAAPAAPADEEALIFDLSKMIESQESLGWSIDRYEIEGLLAEALLSVCATTEATRATALTRLDAQIEALGGPPEETFRRSGGDLREIEEVLSLSRVRMLLEEAVTRAPAECPFWIRPSVAFQGRQTDANRFTVNFEGGGLLILQRADGRITPGGGGSGRLLLGRGLSTAWTILVGGEMGGAALFEQSATETHIPVGFVAATPIVLRHIDLTWHYDFEVAPIAYFTQADTRVSPGVRGGLLVGISALRIRGIMPWAGLGAAFEYVIGTSFRPALWTIKTGARLGADWDF